MKNKYTKHDFEAIKILDDFLPDKIFDGHMHISPYPFCKMEKFGIEDYKRDMAPVFGNRYIRGMALATPTKELKNYDGYLKHLNFFSDELDLHKDFVGSILVKPGQSYDEITSCIQHECIKGLKCYHIYAAREDTQNADIHEYLPEEALEVANKLSMTLTLHLVKSRALADPVNLQEIKYIAKKYPNIKLILAHCARSYATWTVIETVSELVPYENIFFDFAAICESPSIIGILNKIGTSRCIWGSDYNVSMDLGKAIALGDSFYWINERNLLEFNKSADIHPRHIITENLMAVREAAIISSISKKDVEDMFYNNACQIFA